jgi:hypothetical protein
MRVSQRTDSLLGGVSQRPAHLRSDEQAAASVNTLFHPIHGLLKRPPTTHVAQVSASTVGFTSPYVFTINRAVNERYFVVVAEGDVKVFDAQTGAAVTVYKPDAANATTYLTGTDGFRATTVGDYTFLANRSTVVKQGTAVAPAAAYEGLIVVKLGDFATDYTVILDGTTVTYHTPDETAASAKSAAQPGAIATALLTALQGSTVIGPLYTFTQYGSTIHVKRVSGSAFTLVTHDGLSDTGLRAIVGHIQNFDELPDKARDGMMVKVVGDPGTEQDDYWVQYSESETADEAGVWRECPAPGSPLSLDANTMPWSLILRGSIFNGSRAHLGQPSAPGVSHYLGSETRSSYNAIYNAAVLSSSPSGSVYPVVSGHDWSLRDTASGAPGIFRVQTTFSVDATQLGYGDYVTVDLVRWIGGTSVSVLSSRRYTAGAAITDDSFDIETVLAATDHVGLRLQYGSGSTPASSTDLAYLTAHIITSVTDASGFITYSGGLSYRKALSTLLTLPDALYPPGTVFAFQFSNTTSGTVSVSYTLTGTTLVAAASVITSLAAYINGLGLSIFATASGTSLLVDTAHGLSTQHAVNVDSLSATLSPTTIFSPGLLPSGTTAGSLVGKTIKNASDGSSGTITANTLATITVAALVGGVSNKFNKGDLCTVEGTGKYFVFTQNVWENRAAGDLVQCPFPSFLNHTIDEVFFLKNRLGFTSGENVVMSAAGDLFRLSRYSAAQLLDDDCIDVKTAMKDVTSFHSAIPWLEGLHLQAENGEYMLTGEPALTPRTVRIDPTGSYATSGRMRPVPFGTTLLLSTHDTGYTRLLEFASAFTEDGWRSDASDLCRETPRFLDGNPVMVVADAGLGFVAVHTDNSASTLHVFSGFTEGGKRSVAAWSKWTLAGASIIGMDMVDGKLGLLLTRSGAVYWETVDIANPPLTNGSNAVWSDRAGSGAAAEFSLAHTLSRVFSRDEQGRAISNGRFQLEKLVLSYEDAKHIKATVTNSQSGATYSVEFTASSTPASGDLTVPLLADAAHVTVALACDHGGCRITALEWYGEFTPRQQERQQG